MTTIPASTATCGCGTILATWDPRLRAWMPPLGEAARIHDTTCRLQATSDRRVSA